MMMMNLLKSQRKKSKNPKKGKGKRTTPKKKSKEAKEHVLEKRPEAVEKEAKDENPDDPKSDWQYGKIRNLYINNHRSKGCSYKEACEIWDDSVEKAQLLSLVPLPELKKRRFLGREVTVNPWLEKLRGTT